jgi:hypothetical protein
LIKRLTIWEIAVKFYMNLGKNISKTLLKEEEQDPYLHTSSKMVEQISFRNPNKRGQIYRILSNNSLLYWNIVAAIKFQGCEIIFS